MKRGGWQQGRRQGRAIAILTLLLCALPLRAQTPEPFRVIVNPANTVTEVERSFIERAFLKKITRWPDGTVIRPADQAPGSAIRRAFSEDILDRPVAAIRSYWQQAIFDGRDVPPPELDNDAEVIDYVLKTPGGVGYVSPSASLKGARSVRIQ